MYRFEPLLKQTLWGGDKIIPFKHLNVSLDHVGESWELSGVSGSETIVADGPDKGKSLNQLVSEQKERLLGKDNYDRFGDEFPLLVKFIDAQKDLSIQVHPNDEVAHRHGKPRGKTEMWYCLGDMETSKQGVKEKPFIYNGLKQKITPEQYAQMVENDTITDALARYDVHEGDVFFIAVILAQLLIDLPVNLQPAADDHAFQFDAVQRLIAEPVCHTPSFGK